MKNLICIFYVSHLVILLIDIIYILKIFVLIKSVFSCRSYYFILILIVDFGKQAFSAEIHSQNRFCAISNQYPRNLVSSPLVILTHIYTVAEWNYFTRKENAGTTLYEFHEPFKHKSFHHPWFMYEARNYGTTKTNLISACNRCELEPT